MKHGKQDELVLAIQPTTQGFGFALLEAPLSPVDWGSKRGPSPKNATTLAQVATLIEWYEPTVLVIEDARCARYRRSLRVRRLLRGIEQLSRTKNITVHRYSRALIRKCFSGLGATTKFEIAQVIGKHVPAFAPHVPRRRKIWMKEDPRMAIFDAVALAFTYFYFDTDPPVPRTGRSSTPSR